MILKMEKTLAFHCGPALAGIKASNLVSLSFCDYPNLFQDLKEYNKKMNRHGIHLRIVCRCSKRLLVLVYRNKQLNQAVYDKLKFNYLQKTGYPSSNNLEDILKYLETRFEVSNQFPHEIGIFLGYPMEDVMGFCMYKGKHFKIDGYWKVYGDEKATAMLFERYTKCRTAICHHIYNGSSIVQLFAA